MSNAISGVLQAGVPRLAEGPGNADVLRTCNSIVGQSPRLFDGILAVPMLFWDYIMLHVSSRKLLEHKPERRKQGQQTNTTYHTVARNAVSHCLPFYICMPTWAGSKPTS